MALQTRDSAMNVFIRAMIPLLLAWCTSAFAFENIEADAVYDREIKQQIMNEFALGLKMLKAQADGLGMAVRERIFRLCSNTCMTRPF
jgi:hypothetical protein